MSAAFLVVLGMTVLMSKPGDASPSGELLEESWEIVQIEGAKLGFLHTTIHQLDSAPASESSVPKQSLGTRAKILRATAELNLTLKRQGALLRLRRVWGDEETAEGKVVSIFMRQGQEGGKQLVLEGRFEDGHMHVCIDGGRIDRRLRWGDDVVGLYRLEQSFRQRKPKAGDSWTLKRYDPTYNAVVTLGIAVQEHEKGLRVEMTPRPLETQGAKVQPPPEVWWLDERFHVVRRQIELEGLGTVLLARTTKEAATSAATPRQLTDIGLKTLVPLNRALPRPYTTRSAVYRITLRGDRDLLSPLVCNDHQEIRNRQRDTFELHVHPVQKSPLPKMGRLEGAPEYLASCYFIDCDDARVKELARRAVGSEKDAPHVNPRPPAGSEKDARPPTLAEKSGDEGAWAKARRIERWVKQNMRVDNVAPLGPASETACQLRGDCRHYALLTAALCRAEGIPSRTAIGLLYVEKNHRPMMGFHMWTEVWIDGQWLGLDATLGLGGVSAAHIKINDHSWHDVSSLTPLLPVSRVVGKIAITVVHSEP